MVGFENKIALSYFSILLSINENNRGQETGRRKTKARKRRKEKKKVCFKSDSGGKYLI